MTALERAEAVVRAYELRLGLKKARVNGYRELIDAIHKACIEHSNAELERRRVAEKELNTLAAAIAKRPLLAEAVKKALLADAPEGGE